MVLDKRLGDHQSGYNLSRGKTQIFVPENLKYEPQS